MSERLQIGIWSEIPSGQRWTNEGITRILGFLIEGAANSKRIRFHLCVAHGMRQIVREDLLTLQATEHVDWIVVEPPKSNFTFNSPRAKELANLLSISPEVFHQAMFANENVPVLGWIVSFPNFTGAMLLKAPRTTLLPDAIPYDFPLGWKNDWFETGQWPIWRRKVRNVLAFSELTVAHSCHVAERHGVRVLGLPPSKIRVLPHAPPDLEALVPHIEDRRRTSESVQFAAALLRAHAIETGAHYLSDFAFENSRYCVVSTQDRPTKNLVRAADAVRSLIRDTGIDYKMITTSSLDSDEDWTQFPKLIEKEALQFDVLNMPDLPRAVHAALYHCAALTIHPSFYEGIVGTLTFYESVSIGTPCLMARGPHVAELLKQESCLAAFVFDPYDTMQLRTLIERVLANREAALDIQQTAYRRLRRRCWDDVANEYAAAAMESSITDQAETRSVVR